MATAGASAQTQVHYVSFSAEISQQTTETLLGVCAKLANDGVQTVYLLLSTPGGNVMNGVTIYNTLRGLPFHLITHNVGNVDSIGNLVFLAGEERYSSPHTTFMFHGVGFDIKSQTRLEEKNLRESLQSILADQKKIGAIISERTNLQPQEVDQLFLEAMTRDPSYAQANGIIDGIRDVEIPPGAPFSQLAFKR